MRIMTSIGMLLTLSACTTTETVEHPPAIKMAAEAPTEENIEKQIEDLQALARKHPTIPEPHTRLGTIYEKLRYYELAEEEYRTALELSERSDKGQYTGPLFDLGRVLTKRERFQEARPQLQAVLDIKPANPRLLFRNTDYRDAAYLLGMIAKGENKPQEASDFFQRYVDYGGDRANVAAYLLPPSTR